MSRMLWAIAAVLTAVLPFAAQAENYEPFIWRDRAHRLADRFEPFAAVPHDPQGRIAYGSPQGRINVLEFVEGQGYRSIWTSPSLATRIPEVQIKDLNGDGFYELIAYNALGTLYIYDVDNFSLVWKTQEGAFRSIEALAVANVDDYEELELLFLSEGVLHIYDGVDFIEEWHSDEIYDATDLVVGEVDGDGELEIVINTGHVLDARTRRLEWESADPFGEHLELADIDGDGRLEVIGGEGSAITIWDIDERREKWD